MFIKHNAKVAVHACGRAVEPVKALLSLVFGACNLTITEGHCPPWPAERDTVVTASYWQDDFLYGRGWRRLLDDLDHIRQEAGENTLYVETYQPEGYAAFGWGEGELERVGNECLPLLDKGEALAEWFSKARA